MNKDYIYTFVATCIAIVAACAVIYGLFIYNNNQNIKRDEFIAAHCKMITQHTLSNTWTCGGSK